MSKDAKHCCPCPLSLHSFLTFENSTSEIILTFSFSFSVKLRKTVCDKPHVCQAVPVPSSFGRFYLLLRLQQELLLDVPLTSKHAPSCIITTCIFISHPGPSIPLLMRSSVRAASFRLNSQHQSITGTQKEIYKVRQENWLLNKKTLTTT